jgi:tryptophanase
VYIDARAELPHIDPLAYPGWALMLALYLEGGIRCVEVGTVMFGRHADGSEAPAELDLVRLAFPRRVYTQSHVDYVLEVLLHVHARRERIRGLRIVDEPPRLRHFAAVLEPLEGTVIVPA